MSIFRFIFKYCIRLYYHFRQNNLFITELVAVRFGFGVTKLLTVLLLFTSLFVYCKFDTALFLLINACISFGRSLVDQSLPIFFSSCLTTLSISSELISVLTAISSNFPILFQKRQLLLFSIFFLQSTPYIANI